ncbi:hypothetical protein BN8_06654 [Fibrisoma limi BUZ 3]|uniref:Uncharacterized protein n=1 Tax=Fibrisoma limi BUZ 3 TaxID=1185876 RepID=I2GTL7_9BACT|nr:hypothetical protein BN8_06654 [Fibrisoma limi BUZ 3]
MTPTEPIKADVLSTFIYSAHVIGNVCVIAFSQLLPV